MTDLKNASNTSNTVDIIEVTTPIKSEQALREEENYSLNQALAHLRMNDFKHRQTAIQYALNHPKEVTPFLLEILQNTLSNPNQFIPPVCDGDHSFEEPCLEEIWEAGHSSWVHLYAIMLLGEFKEKKAHSLLLQLCNLPEDTLEDLFGDFITTEFPYLLYSTYEGSPEGIKNLILEKDADDLSRLVAVDALAFLVADQKLDRLETLDFLASLFQGDEAEEDSSFWDFIAEAILQLYPSEKMEIIEAAYQRGLITDFVTTLDEFKETIQTSSVEECLKDLKTDLDKHFQQDFEQRIAWLSDPSSKYFLSEEALDELDEDDMSFFGEIFKAENDNWNSPYIRENPKIGRNDPCLCGSGKKYKKCCLGISKGDLE